MAKEFQSHKSLLEKGLELEKDGAFDQAEKLYLETIKNHPLEVGAYNRLMIIYRKQRAIEKEQKIILQAIKAYEEDVKNAQTTWVKSNRKAARLSKQLVQSLGLLDKRGMPINEPPQIETWRRRLVNLKKKS
jgi:hypothetical protein